MIVALFGQEAETRAVAVKNDRTDRRTDKHSVAHISDARRDIDLIELTVCKRLIFDPCHARFQHHARISGRIQTLVGRVSIQGRSAFVIKSINVVCDRKIAVGGIDRKAADLSACESAHNILKQSGQREHLDLTAVKNTCLKPCNGVLTDIVIILPRGRNILSIQHRGHCADLFGHILFADIANDICRLILVKDILEIAHRHDRRLCQGVRCDLRTEVPPHRGDHRSRADQRHSQRCGKHPAHDSAKLFHKKHLFQKIFH